MKPSTTTMSREAMYSSWSLAIRSPSSLEIACWELPSGSSRTRKVEAFERARTSVWTFRLPYRVSLAFGIFAASSLSSSAEGLTRTDLASGSGVICFAIGLESAPLKTRLGRRGYRLNGHSGALSWTSCPGVRPSTPLLSRYAAQRKVRPPGAPIRGVGADHERDPDARRRGAHRHLAGAGLGVLRPPGPERAEEGAEVRAPADRARQAPARVGQGPACQAEAPRRAREGPGPHGARHRADQPAEDRRPLRGRARHGRRLAAQGARPLPGHELPGSGRDGRGRRPPDDLRRAVQPDRQAEEGRPDRPRDAVRALQLHGRPHEDRGPDRPRGGETRPRPGAARAERLPPALQRGAAHHRVRAAQNRAGDGMRTPPLTCDLSRDSSSVISRTRIAIETASTASQ